MEYSAIIVRKEDGVAIVTINQPKTMNSLVDEVRIDLTKAAVELSKDPEVKVIVLTGTGKAFCAGGDLNRFVQGFTKTEAMDYIEDFQPMVQGWANMKKPVIAAVNGAAMGAGLSLMLTCDLAFASENAKISAAFINVGLIPECGCAYLLPRVVGIQKAKELVFTGKVLAADEAYGIGLVNGVYPAEELMPNVMALAKKLAKGPTFALRQAKRLLNCSLDMDYNKLLTVEVDLQSACFLTEDSHEAVEAFLEKRKPVFKGC